MVADGVSDDATGLVLPRPRVEEPDAVGGPCQLVHLVGVGELLEDVNVVTAPSSPTALGAVS